VNTYAPWTDMTFVNKTTVSATGGGLKFTMNQPGSDTPVTVLHVRRPAAVPAAAAGCGRINGRNKRPPATRGRVGRE
jgi:hypothetical protein